MILNGEKWKESREIAAYLHACIFHNDSDELFFPNKAKVFRYSEDCGEKLEDFCLEHYLIQDAHERLLSGECSSEHLSKKLKIFTPSYKTYIDEKGIITEKRAHVHAKILTRVFENTAIKKSENEWFEYLQTINQKGIQKILKEEAEPSWFLYLGGGQGSGKTTLLHELQSNNIVSEHAAIINSRLFFDFLFQDVPYVHKVQLWPYFSEEKKYLTMLITKIAMAHQVSLVIDTHILFVDFCRELTDIVREYEGKSSMIALYNPLEDCYFREQTSVESHFEESNKLVYEQLMFHKLFASNWKEFVSNFDNSILIDQAAGQIVFLSGKTGCFTPSLDKIKSFLNLNSIDPDELSNELVLLDLKQGTCKIREYMQKIVFDATKELIPKGTEISELDLEILKTIEDLKEML